MDFWRNNLRNFASMQILFARTFRACGDWIPQSTNAPRKAGIK
jgi:hypothetical protein